jgi:outer membrane protein TolC
MRWITLLVVGLGAALAVAAGCTHPVYLTESDLSHYREMGLPADLPCSPEASVVPSSAPMSPPATTEAPERPVRYMSLAEALAIALERGTIGGPGLDGTTSDLLLSYGGGVVVSPENKIRVLALDPAIIGTNIDAALSKFDTLWNTSLNWSNTDQGTGGNFLTSFQNGERATLQSALLKPLPTGGVAGMTFTTNYTDLATPAAGFLNPTYRPILQFQFEQPLLQGFGVEINQLRASHPGSILTPFNTLARVEGILITRIRFDQQRAEFERNLHQLLVNVEVAYWNLYGYYGVLYASEQALRQAYEAWSINRQRFQVGRVNIQDLSQTRGQYEMFRGQRLSSLNQVLEGENQLRGLLGLPLDDGTRLVPSDAPSIAPFQPDWLTSVNESLALRPELILAREDLKFRQLDLINQKNLLLPDLRFTSTYDVNGVGSHLDGGSNDVNNAFHSLASDKFNDWSVGLTMTVPLGFRNAHSAVRTAQLKLARSYLVLKDQEYKAQRYLGQQYRLLEVNNKLIEIFRSEREAYALQLRGRFMEFLAGRGTLDFLLEAQRDWASALSAEYTAIANYNSSLSRFEFAKGTIMTHDNVVIGEGPLPHSAQIRAVEHERERNAALIARERAQPVAVPRLECAGQAVAGPPELPTNAAPSLLRLFEGQKDLPPVPDSLPGTPAPSVPVQGLDAKLKTGFAERPGAGMRPATNPAAPLAPPSWTSMPDGSPVPAQISGFQPIDDAGGGR